MTQLEQVDLRAWRLPKVSSDVAECYAWCTENGKVPAGRLLPDKDTLKELLKVWPHSSNSGVNYAEVGLLLQMEFPKMVEVPDPNGTAITEVTVSKINVYKVEVSSNDVISIGGFIFPGSYSRDL